MFTWGCNDEGVLGGDGDEYTPLPVVKLKDHVIRQRDSHTAALTSSGSVYFWDVFRVSVCVCVCVFVFVHAYVCVCVGVLSEYVLHTAYSGSYLINENH